MNKEEIEIESSLLVTVGKRLRKYFNPAIRRYSKVGDTPVLDVHHFPWTKTIEENWEVIRKEAEAILKFQDAIPPLSLLSPDHEGLDKENKWLSYFLFGYGYKSSANCARCPETTKLVEAIPGMTTALFSIHQPGMCIKPHEGVTSGICVVHMGLIVPKDSQHCAIRVEDHVHHWKNGQSFAFDDTFQHETWNRTDEQRVILLVHVKRPARFPGSFLAALFYSAIQRTSFIQDAVDNMQSWELEFQKLENKQRNKMANDANP